jgi:pimeloyl-ACP methyl ester carboxylesterase
VTRRRRSLTVRVTYLKSLSSFPDLSSLPDAFRLVADTNGLLAQFPGSITGTATVLFDHPLNLNEPTQVGILFEYGGGADVAQVQLQDPTDTSFAGMSFQVSSANLKCTYGTHNAFATLTGLVVGQRYWMGVCWDTTGDINVFCIPAMHKGLLNPPFNGTVLQDTKVVLPKTINGGGGGNLLTFGNVTKMAIFQRSGTSRILALFSRQGNNSGGTLPRLEPPLLINSTVNGDTTPTIRTKFGYTGVGQRDAVIIFHGANSSESYGSDFGAYDDGVAVANLVQNGYITAYMRGTDDFSGTTFSGPKASNWGNVNSLDTWWKALHTKLTSEFDIRNIYLLGMSMGLVNALNFYARYPTGIKGILGVSGVCNLSYAFNTEGFASVISAAHGGAPDLPNNDPNLRASLYAGVPIKLWHGTVDATVSKVNHMDTFAATVNALVPGRVSTVSVVGGGHLTADMFDGAAMLAFLQANP